MCSSDPESGKTIRLKKMKDKSKEHDAHLRHRIVGAIRLDWALDVAWVSGSEPGDAPHLRLDFVIIELIATFTRPHWLDATAERLHSEPVEGGNKVHSTCLAPKALQKATKERQQGLGRLLVFLRQRVRPRVRLPQLAISREVGKPFLVAPDVKPLPPPALDGVGFLQARTWMPKPPTGYTCLLFPTFLLTRNSDFHSSQLGEIPRKHSQSTIKLAMLKTLLGVRSWI